MGALAVASATTSARSSLTRRLLRPLGAVLVGRVAVDRVHVGQGRGAAEAEAGLRGPARRRAGRRRAARCATRSAAAWAATAALGRELDPERRALDPVVRHAAGR